MMIKLAGRTLHESKEDQENQEEYNFPQTISKQKLSFFKRI